MASNYFFQLLVIEHKLKIYCSLIFSATFCCIFICFIPFQVNINNAVKIYL